MSNDKNSTYRICKKCVMDTTAPSIIFDENGVCSFCHNYDKNSNQFSTLDKETREKKLSDIFYKIKIDSTKKKI